MNERSTPKKRNQFCPDGNLGPATVNGMTIEKNHPHPLTHCGERRYGAAFASSGGTGKKPSRSHAQAGGYPDEAIQSRMKRYRGELNER
jgi:hypothetical protein